MRSTMFQRYQRPSCIKCCTSNHKTNNNRGRIVPCRMDENFFHLTFLQDESDGIYCYDDPIFSILSAEIQPNELTHHQSYRRASDVGAACCSTTLWLLLIATTFMVYGRNLLHHYSLIVAHLPYFITRDLLLVSRIVSYFCLTSRVQRNQPKQKNTSKSIQTNNSNNSYQKRHK